MNLVRNCAHTANMDKHIGLSLLFALIFFGCDNGGGGGGGDNSDTNVVYGGQTYKTVVIGTQTWFAENLNYAVEGSWCYENSPANCAKYGRLYNWATAMALPDSCNTTACAGRVSAKHRGICPSGWHIPSNADWDKLFHYVDRTSGTLSPYSSPTAGRYLKTTSGWDENGNGADTYGFAALPVPAAYFYTGSGNFYDYDSGGTGSNWWSATEDDDGRAYTTGMTYDSDGAGWGNDAYDWLFSDVSFLFSVRCVKD